MGLSIYRLSILLILVFSTLGKDIPTLLTYYVEYEVDQQNDYIEISLQIEASSRILTDALSSANKTAAQIAALANKYCKTYAKNQKECEDAVEISQFQISPKYQMIRKQAKFESFNVVHQITIKIVHTDDIGYLVNSFLKYELLTIKGFQWLPFQEKDSEEEAIKQGLEQGQGLCNQAGLTFKSVLGVEEIAEKQQEDGKQDQEEQQEQQAPEIVVYKFSIECIPKQQKAKPSSSPKKQPKAKKEPQTKTKSKPEQKGKQKPKKK